jgi:hypothetical protein
LLLGGAALLARGPSWSAADLSAGGDRHDARGRSLCRALDLEWLGAERHIRRVILAQQHRPDMQPGARTQGEAQGKRIFERKD